MFLNFTSFTAADGGPPRKPDIGDLIVSVDEVVSVLESFYLHKEKSDVYRVALVRCTGGVTHLVWDQNRSVKETVIRADQGIPPAEDDDDEGGDAADDRPEAPGGLVKS